MDRNNFCLVSGTTTGAQSGRRGQDRGTREGNVGTAAGCATGKHTPLVLLSLLLTRPSDACSVHVSITTWLKYKSTTQGPRTPRLLRVELLSRAVGCFLIQLLNWPRVLVLRHCLGVQKYHSSDPHLSEYTPTPCVKFTM